MGLSRTNVPMPRCVASTPARSSSAYTFATVLALMRSSTASCRTVGSRSPGLQAPGGDRGANAAIELRVERSRVGRSRRTASVQSIVLIE